VGVGCAHEIPPGGRDLLNIARGIENLRAGEHL